MPPTRGQAQSPGVGPALTTLPATILAWSHIVVAGGVLAAALLSLATLGTSEQPYLALSLLVWAWPVTLALCFLAVPLVGGVGLLRRRPWARGLIIAVSVAYLFVLPIGTAWGAFGLWVLLRHNPAHAGASAAYAAGPKRSLGPLLWVMVGTAVFFVALVGVGYSLDRLGYTLPRVPVGRDTRLVVGLSAITVGALVLAVRSVIGGMSSRRVSTTLAQERRQRVKTLRANPAMHWLADRIEAGQHWSEAQIAYAVDHDQLATCLHLQPIERAMRDSGIACRPTSPAAINAECCVDTAALGPSAPVSYREWLQSERGEAGSPEAALCCEACRSEIFLIHPDAALPETPRFPRASRPERSRMDQQR